VKRSVIALLALALVAPLALAERAALLTEIALSDLPPEARVTVARVKSGGPFPYAKDGSVFGNRERHLPRQSRGYYRE